MSIAILHIRETYQLVDTVSSVLSYDSVALWLDNRLNLVADVPVQHTGLAHSDGALGRFPRGGDELGILVADHSDRVSCVDISVETCQVERSEHLASFSLVIIC